MSAVNAEAVARELSISYDLFLRTRKDLERQGFPPPLPLVGRLKRGRPPLRWSLDAVRDWIRNPRPALTLKHDLSERHMRAIAGNDRDKLSRRVG